MSPHTFIMWRYKYIYNKRFSDVSLNIYYHFHVLNRVHSYCEDEYSIKSFLLQDIVGFS